MKPSLPTTKDRQNATGHAMAKAVPYSISPWRVGPKCRSPKKPVMRNAIIPEMKN
jgi:hypothetical protein